MVTGNGNPRYPPPSPSGQYDLAGRRRVPHPPRLDSLKIDPRTARTASQYPRSAPHSPRSPRAPRARSPMSMMNAPQDDRLWLSMPTQHAPSPGSRDEWGTTRSPAYSSTQTTTFDSYSPKWHNCDSELDRPTHRKAPPARGGGRLHISMSNPMLNNRQPTTYDSPDRHPQDLSLYGLPLPRFPANGPADEDTLRSSFNSAMTSGSSIEQASGTERNSVLTKSSSITDLSPDTPDAPYMDMDGGMSVEDAISMYLDDFSDVTEEPASPKSRAERTPPPSRHAHLHEPPPVLSYAENPPIPALPQSTPPDPTLLEPSLPEPTLPEPYLLEPTLPEPAFSEPAFSEPAFSEPALSEPALHEPTLPEPTLSEATLSEPTLADVLSAHQRQPSKVIIPGSVPPPLLPASDTRDSYGFRKVSQHVTAGEYEAWSGPYSNYAAHRRAKWHDLLQEHGISTNDPINFPPQSSKMKRFVRKGIPSEFRGAAWFWYAGGHEILSRNIGYYDELVKRAMASPSNDDKEHIERDLHRTFPDNFHFKPETADPPGDSGSSNLQQQSVKAETQMIQSLRRVLYSFALHNAKIGYTQSLNFITGMLLLFLPEEKAFWMLHIITSAYLPGTHEISLEGANIDLWVLMVLLRDSMPGIYARIASMGEVPSGRGRLPALTVHSRLPDITLGLTNWLMSVFIGTLPLETTLRVWDVFFYEGSKTFFRVSLAIFKACEREIFAVSDPMEVFQVVQTVPKKLLDANALLEDCFMRRHRVGQGRIDELRSSRRTAVRQEKLRRSVAFCKGQIQLATDDFPTRARTPIPGIEHRVVDSWRQLKQHRFR